MNQRGASETLKMPKPKRQTDPVLNEGEEFLPSPFPRSIDLRSTNLRVGEPGTAMGTGSEHLKNKGTAFAQSRVILNLHLEVFFFWRSLRLVPKVN
jgi:hypothetical protein